MHICLLKIKHGMLLKILNTAIVAINNHYLVIKRTCLFLRKHQNITDYDCRRVRQMDVF